jgi:ABC-2 type transport system ATP-binding protein
LADAAPWELAEVMHLKNLEGVFAQLIQQEDTSALARQVVDVMKVNHA